MTRPGGGFWRSHSSAWPAVWPITRRVKSWFMQVVTGSPRRASATFRHFLPGRASFLLSRTTGAGGPTNPPLDSLPADAIRFSPRPAHPAGAAGVHWTSPNHRGPDDVPPDQPPPSDVSDQPVTGFHPHTHTGFPLAPP